MYGVAFPPLSVVSFMYSMTSVHSHTVCCKFQVRHRNAPTFPAAHIPTHESWSEMCTTTPQE